MTHDMRTISHVNVRHTPPIPAVTDFLTAIFREEEDLLAGGRPGG